MMRRLRPGDRGYLAMVKLFYLRDWFSRTRWLSEVAAHRQALEQRGGTAESEIPELVKGRVLVPLREPAQKDRVSARFASTIELAEEAEEESEHDRGSRRLIPG
jgi:hypothetical protein